MSPTLNDLRPLEDGALLALRLRVGAFLVAVSKFQPRETNIAGQIPQQRRAPGKAVRPPRSDIRRAICELVPGYPMTGTGTAREPQLIGRPAHCS